ncbi:MAG: aldo/keto reductase [Gammaproteobacteria bacterium]|nr:aldo/keto reductase [Gammaproteobacteria bacterium]
MPSGYSISRRQLLKQGLLLGSIAAVPALGSQISKRPIITKPIPTSGQPLPIIGMGTWITFNVGQDIEARLKRTQVLKTFLEQGGQLVDSSPMYGSAEEVLGFCRQQLGQRADDLFSATKVWTSSTSEGRSQIDNSHRLWGLDKFNLFQVHNLVNWRDHLDTLFNMKAEGRLQYVGITTSHGRRHVDLEQIMKTQPIDFVQLTYHIDNRAVEKRLLPLAQDRGIAIIANRPFSGGDLFDDYEHQPLPEWSHEIDCHNWAQFFLKFVVSHPAITCAIPATSRVDHMLENMGALKGPLPEADMRKEMLKYVSRL